jgi:hypothetical protein
VRLVWIALALIACSSRDQPPQKTERQPRVIDPPPQGVRALPPHAIRADGVGPYRLGAPLEQLGNQVPSGARIAQVDIPLVVHLNVMHAEEDAVLVGTADPLGRAAFVSVLRGDIARTASGIHIGSTREELVKALGAPMLELGRARDPTRVVVPSNMRELRAVMDNDRIVGMVVAASEPPPKDVEGCVRPIVDADDSLRAPHTKFGACMTGAPDIVTQDGDELSIRPVDSDKIVALWKIPNLVWAAPLRTPDGRDELVAIARTDEVAVRTWFLFAYRFDSGGSRPVRVVDPTPGSGDGVRLYQLTAANARWIGSELRDLDLDLEVTSHPETIEVGGLLTTHSGGRLHDLVVLSSVQVSRRRAKSSTPEATDAGVPDAHMQP